MQCPRCGHLSTNSNPLPPIVNWGGADKRRDWLQIVSRVVFTFSEAGWRHALPFVHRVTQPSGLCRYDLWGRRHPEATCTERTSTTDDDDQPSGVQRGPQPVIIVLYLVVLPVGTCRRQINVGGRWLNACRTEGVEIFRLKARFESIHGLSRVEMSDIINRIEISLIPYRFYPGFGFQICSGTLNHSLILMLSWSGRVGISLTFWVRWVGSFKMRFEWGRILIKLSSPRAKIQLSRK